MKKYFIVHGSYGTANEHYIPWLKTELENRGDKVIALNFPIGKDVQTYDSWSMVLDKYKNEIDEETIFIGRSIGPIFIIKYLIENNLKIKSLYSISGFNCFINIPDYDYVNKTFFLDEIKDVDKLIAKRVCFISKNDPYVPYYLLDMFTHNLKAEVVLKENAGHFNEDSGYSKFVELLDIL